MNVSFPSKLERTVACFVNIHGWWCILTGGRRKVGDSAEGFFDKWLLIRPTTVDSRRVESLLFLQDIVVAA